MNRRNFFSALAAAPIAVIASSAAVNAVTAAPKSDVLRFAFDDWEFIGGGELAAISTQLDAIGSQGVLAQTSAQELTTQLDAISCGCMSRHEARSINGMFDIRQGIEL